MNTANANIGQIRKEAGGYTADALTRLDAAILTGYHTEHNPDDTHKIIHATGPVFERSRTTALGDPIAIPFVPGDFTANAAMTWTVGAGDITTWSYTLIGTRMIVDCVIQNTTVGGAVAQILQMKIPGGWYAAASAFNPIYALDNAVASSVVASVLINTNIIRLIRLDAANWTAAAAATSVYGQLGFPIRTA